jgi:hypothetical protein
MFTKFNRKNIDDRQMDTLIGIITLYWELMLPTAGHMKHMVEK